MQWQWPHSSWGFQEGQLLSFPAEPLRPFKAFKTTGLLTVGCAGAWCAGSHRGLVPSEHPGVTLNCNTLGTAAKAAVVGGSTQTLRAPFSWALTCCWLSQRAPCSPQGTASLGWSTLRLARLQGVTKFRAHLKYATFDPQPQSSVMMHGSYCEWEGGR